MHIVNRVLIHKREELDSEEIISRKRTPDGRLLKGKSNTDPLLDTRIYGVYFYNCSKGKYGTNILTKAITESTQEETWSDHLFDGIIGHHQSNETIDTRNGLSLANSTKKRVI